MVRDAQVLRHQFGMFFARTVMQPFLITLVFAYVFPRPRSGLREATRGRVAGYGADPAARSDRLAIMFQGVSWVALPLRERVQREQGDQDPHDGASADQLRPRSRRSCSVRCRRCWPLSWCSVCVAQFARDVTSLHVDSWLRLTVVLTLACLASASLGLLLGTVFAPQTVPLIFSLIVIPVMFLGCTLLPVEGARGDPLVADPGARQSARVRERGIPRSADTAGAPHVAVGHLRHAARTRRWRWRRHRHTFRSEGAPPLVNFSLHTRAHGGTRDGLEIRRHLRGDRRRDPGQRRAR